MQLAKASIAYASQPAASTPSTGLSEPAAVSPTPPPASLGSLTLSAKQRRELVQREQILDEWQQALSAAVKLGLTKDKATAMFLLSVQDRLGKPITRATLYNWKSARKSGGRAALVDGRKGRNQPIDSKFFPFLEEWKRLWLRQSQPKSAACYDYAKVIAEREGFPIPSIKTVERFRRALDPRAVIKYRFGDTVFKNKVLPCTDRDYTTLASNEMWCSDHMRFDVIVNIGTVEEPKYDRPWLTSWEDVRSRKVVSHRIYAHDPNATEVLMSFRSGCLAVGVPDHVLIDNGEDYDCRALQGMTKEERRHLRTWKAKVRDEHLGIFGVLQVDVIHSIAYNPGSKMIESWHRTVHDRFDRFQATYCGPTTDQKPEDLPDQIRRGAPLLKDFIAAFSAWLEGDYHLNHDHSGQGMNGETPAVIFAANLKSKRTATPETLELLIQRTSRPLKVGRQGVAFDGRSYGAGDDLLGPWFGKQVYLRVGDDVTEASVWTLDDRFIGRIRMNQLGTFIHATDEQYRQAARAKRSVSAAVSAAAALGPKRHMSVADHLAEIARRDSADKAKNPDPAPGSVRMVQTPFSGQEEQIRKAFERPLKIAAGAEGMRGTGVSPVDLISAAADLDMPARRNDTQNILSLADQLGE